MRLKSREKFIPGEFQVLIPQAGMKQPFKGSFSEAVQFLYAFRAKNTALTEKHGWSLDLDVVADDVDAYNAQRMAAAGYFNFVEMEANSIQKKTSSGMFDRVANAAGTIKTALAIYRDLFGPDGKVVAKDEAERRATICVACPKNDTAGGLKKYLVEKAAKEIMGVFSMLKSKNATTSFDDKLGVCQACECPMRAKVHVESHVLKKHIKPDQIAKLDTNCWIPPAIQNA